MNWEETQEVTVSLVAATGSNEDAAAAAAIFVINLVSSLSLQKKKK